MALAERWSKGRWRYAGLVLMALGVATALAIGALAFENVVTVEAAITAVAASVLLIILPGFLLHVVSVVRARRGSGA